MVRGAREVRNEYIFELHAERRQVGYDGMASVIVPGYFEIYNFHLDKKYPVRSVA